MPKFAKIGAKICAHEIDAKYIESSDSVVTVANLFGERWHGCKVDQKLRDNDLIMIGNFLFKVIHTPGHTPGSICLYYPGHVFTGDTLFVKAVGRTDLPGGSWETLIKSIKTRLFTLPEETIVWPGHDYGEKPNSTIGEEKRFNPFIK